MPPSQNAETNQRLIALGVSTVVGVIAIAFMSILFYNPESSLWGDFLLDRHTENFPYPFTLQNMMWIMFFIGCGELWGRFNQSNLESAQLSKRYLPEDETTMLRTQNLGEYYNRIRPVDGERTFFLQRLVMRCILQFQGSRSVSQTNSLLNSSLELFQHELELKYTMLRYLVWLIPTLGFIGTVVGIALALDHAGSTDKPQTPDPALLGEITQRLAVAFYTTLLALVQSAMLVFALHIAQQKEEMALNQSGQYCLDNLINRLYEN